MTDRDRESSVPISIQGNVVRHRCVPQTANVCYQKVSCSLYKNHTFV